VTINEIIRDDNLFIVENLEPQEKVVDDKKVRDCVKIEDENILDLMIVAWTMGKTS
jgi:hypothetical protein